MNRLEVNVFIVLLHLCFFLILTSTIKDELGESSCMYSAASSNDSDKCRYDIVKIEKLPEQCTSFVLRDFAYDDKNEIHYYSRFYIQDMEKAFRDMMYTGKFRFVIYRHTEEALPLWYDSLRSGDFKKEVDAVHDYFTNYGINGMIMKDDVSLVPFENSYQKYADYISALKKDDRSYRIGLYLSARTLVERVNHGTTSTWINFSEMNKIIDFYLIEFVTFNECTDKLLRCGITPFESPDPEIMTLNQFKDAYKQLNIDKEKVHFEFLVSPKLNPAYDKEFEPCEASYNEYCENKKENRKKFCADDNERLKKKGEFVKELSKGFVASYIDLVDRDEHCCKHRKYVTFDLLLCGYQGTKCEDCDALNYT